MKNQWWPPVACALAIGCSACGNAPININGLDINKVVRGAQSAKEATVELTEAQEIALGQGIASNLLGVAPLMPDQNLQRYVNSVGRWLSLQSERPDLPWTFAVLDDNDVNAFAAPGGYIVITKGLLARMNNEAELAGVLAHEIAHVIRKHHLNALRKAAGMSLAKDALSFAVEAKGGSASLLKMASAGTELYTRGLDKEDEYEADRMGVVLAARAGYDPYGLPAVLQILQTINPDSALTALMFKSHPPLSNRLALLDKIMASGFERFEQQPSLRSRFLKLAALTPGKSAADSRSKK